MRYAHLLLPRLAMVAGATAWLAGGAMAQYSPYAAQYQQLQPGYQQPQPAFQQPQPSQQTSQPAYQQTATAFPQMPGSYSAPQTSATPTSAPQSYAPQYMAMMYQNTNGDALSQPLEVVPPGPMQQSNQGEVPPQPAPTQSMQPSYYSGVPTPADGGNCNTAPAMQYSQGAMGGCAGNYNTFSGGCASNYNNCSGGSNVCYASQANCGPRRRWFGGIYGLFMNLEECGYKPLAFQTTSGAGPGYYPTDAEIVMSTADLANDGFGGAEVRFGATFAACNGCGYNDGCGSCGGCGQCAWEFGYWGLFSETTMVEVLDASTYTVDGNRTYGMIDFRGWESNPGGTYRPVNHYFDYGPPTTDNSTPYDIEIRRLYARRQFALQNLELNLLRLPLIGGGGGVSCGVSSCGGSCDSCGGGACGMGNVCGGGCGFAGPRCQVSTLAGIRYLRVDDDFLYRSEWERMDTNGTGWHQYNVEVDNQLVGFQIGANGAYYMGSCGRFGLHCYSNAGIYGNRAEVSQWMDSSSGMTRYANNGNPGSYTNSDDTNVAFLGELRLGASYQCTCNCRIYGGYRVMGITGVAVSYDQVPDYFSSPAQVGVINCRGSYFVHGMQTGIEFLY